MKVFDKKVVKNKIDSRILGEMELAISIALLVVDDGFGADRETSEWIVKAYTEILNGYGASGKSASAALKEEIDARGIVIDLNGGFGGPPSEPGRYERGRCQWIIREKETEYIDKKGIKRKRKKKYYECSRCGKGNAVNAPYCQQCGAVAVRTTLPEKYDRRMIGAVVK